jgi:general secretion pathway protein D
MIARRCPRILPPVCTAILGMLAFVMPSRSVAAQVDSIVMRSDSVMIHLVDVDLRAAVQALGRYLDRPVVIGNIAGARVTFETPQPVPRSDVVRLLRGILASQNIELVADSTGIYRLTPREPPRASMPQPTTQISARPSGQGVQLFVIHLKHARAADVAATVNALYGRASALGELPNQPSTLARSLEAQQVPPGLPTSNAAPQAVPGTAGRNATLTGEITIIPDPRANSLLIRASVADFDLIQAAVEEIDVRPLQVMIEVLIAEVRKDRSLDFGVGVNVPPSKVRGTQNVTVEGSTTGLGLGDFVLKVMGIGSMEATATLQAAASRGDATIVSRPVLLTANNEEAEINVGSQRPFVQVARVLPTDNTARDQVVQYKDVGTKLRVIPTISADGYVMLQVSQEINAATAEQAFDAPVISTRSVQTKLLIRDGQTIVLGGLTDSQHEVQQGGVPLLSSIPLLGGLFGHASRSTTATELFLFLTPRIIRDDQDVDDLTEPLRLKARKIFK